MQTHLPSSVYELLRRHRASCAEKAIALQTKYGSAAAYRRTLRVEVIDRPDAPTLEEFYQLYSCIFTLEDEIEPLEGFAKVLGFNQDSRAQQDFGPFVEQIMVLRDPSDGKLVGAANFAIYAYPGRHEAFGGFNASCQLNFLLVRADLRGLGIATDLLRYMEAEATKFAGQHGGSHHLFTTIEMNDPLRMRPEQVEADVIVALIDPAARAVWWRKQGFKRLDLPYIQPPLSAGVEACTYLDYFIRCTPPADAYPAAIPSAVLREHLRRFFTVSVGKLEIDMQTSSEWRGIAEYLSHRNNVKVSP